MSNLKYVNKVLMTTLLVFSIPTFANYSKTTSKYVKDNYVALESNMSFVNPSGEGDITLLKGNWVELQYRVSFNRNTFVDNDFYEVEVPSGCLIDADGVESKAKTTIDANKVSLAYDNKSDDQISVSYTCTVANLNGTVIDENTTRVTTYAKIYETMDDFRFLFYKDHRITNVKKPHGYVEGDKKEYYYLPDISDLDAEARKHEIETWIRETYPEANGLADLESYITSYLQSAYTETPVDITTIDLGGLDITTKTVDGQKYFVFHITDDFVGYVKTYRGTTHKEDLYFSNTNITEERANEILEDYLEFFYPNSSDGTPSEEHTKISNYIRDSGGIYKVIKGTGSIRGILNGDTPDMFVLSENLMTFIDIFNGEEKPIEYSSTNFNAQTVTTDILTMLSLKYSYLPENIAEDRDLYMAIFMKAMTFTSQKVDEYISYTIKDTNEQILIHLVSNMDELIYVNAVKLSNDEPIVITTRTNSVLYTATSLIEFISKIDEENAKSDTLDDTLYHTISDLDTILTNGGIGSIQNGDFVDSVTVTITNDKGNTNDQKVEITLTHTASTNDVPEEEENTTQENLANMLVPENASIQETAVMQEMNVQTIEPLEAWNGDIKVDIQELSEEAALEVLEKKEELLLVKLEGEENSFNSQKEEILD